jgi:hypothetical protein
MKKILSALILTAMTLSARGILQAPAALAAPPAQQLKSALNPAAPQPAGHQSAKPKAAMPKSASPQASAPLRLTSKSSASEDARLVLERVNLARMWLKQKDNNEAILQVRDAIQLMNQMKPKLTAPLEELIYSAQTGTLLDAQGQVVLTLVPLAHALDELTSYVHEQPVAQGHIIAMKNHLTQARQQLQAKNEPAAKASLKLAAVELAQFEIDLPVTYTEAHLHQAYGFLREGQASWADSSLKEIETHLVQRSAMTFLSPELAQK